MSREGVIRSWQVLSPQTNHADSQYFAVLIAGTPPPIFDLKLNYLEIKLIVFSNYEVRWEIALYYFMYQNTCPNDQFVK